jgi:tetratricopeptide (TPR) repeat protein
MTGEPDHHSRAGALDQGFAKRAAWSSPETLVFERIPSASWQGWTMPNGRHRILSLAVASWLSVGSPAVADQNDPRLGRLIDALKAAPTAQVARPLEEQIWVIWGRSGDKATDALMAQGIARLNQGDNDTALDLFDRVVKQAPNFAEGWNKRATTLYVMGRFEKSAADIDKVLALEPRHFGALSGLGLCDVRLGKDKEALAAFRRAAAVDPNLPGVQENIEALKQRLIREQI